jgi:NAD+ synthase (glutamine-hydrolysing)
MLASGPRFSYRDYHLTAATIDIDATRMLRARQSSFRPGAAEVRQCEHCEFEFPQVEPQPVTTDSTNWESGNRVKEEEFARAVPLALFDYLRKSHSRGLIVSLSGGADSAAVAVLSSFAVRLAWQEIGAEGVRGKLAYLGLDANSSVADVVRRLLVCVYQSTRHSTERTRAAAGGVAGAIGAEYFEFDVQSLVDGYETRISKALGRPLSWEQDDIARQNIQARVRAPGIWMLANIRGALLLSTSNRSEAAVGYATMDGDTSGGLAPIAGIDKAFLRRWLVWIEKEGPQGLGPIPALELVNVQAPTAELRPQAAQQTDEQDLMPYDVLDAIERAAIRDKLSPVEAWQVLQPQFPQFTAQQLAVWVGRFFQLWCRNQWKRERYAPSFHLDDENLDPKTWCRFPILSGGFRRELEELAGKAKVKIL